MTHNNDMPYELFIEYNEPTIHGEKVIPEYTVQKYPKNPFNGKTLTRYIIATTEPTQDNMWRFDMYRAPVGRPLLTYEYDKDIGDTVEIATLTFDGIWDCRGYERGQYKPSAWKHIDIPTLPDNQE